MTQTSTTKTKPNWARSIAITVGVIVAGFLAIIILLVLAIALLGEEQKPEFRPVGEPLSAPAPGGTPTWVLPIA